MFDDWFDRLFGRSLEVHRRSEGVAFLKAARELYDCTSMAYLALNIPVPGARFRYMHCAYSDGGAKHCLSAEAVACGDAIEEDRGALNSEGSKGSRMRSLTFGVRPKAGESALFGITADLDPEDWSTFLQTGVAEIRILANYFHSHVMRINGFNANMDLIVSARELDCLKWTAAGKTAWEASVILGVSERTVRFHLNAVREKLNCATTAQAVARAVIYQLIDV